MSIDDSAVKNALGSIGMSAALMLGATFLSQGIGFITRITIARYLPVEGYGSVALGISFMNLLGILTLVGLPTAVSRYIPRQENTAERREIITSGLQIVLILSVVIASISLLLVEPIARRTFENEGLAWIFKIFAFVLPFYALFKTSLGGFQGYKRTKPQVLTDKVLLPVLQLGGIVTLVTLGYNAAGIAFAYAGSFLVIGSISFAVIYRIGGISTDDMRRIDIDQYQELLTFSIPLAASGAVGILAMHSDTMILAIFQSTSAVGIYEITFRMAMFVAQSFSPAIAYLFQPLMSELHADGGLRQMEQLLSVTTRWIVAATLPLFALMFLFPEQTLTFFIGKEYAEAAGALSILVTGFMFSQIPGLTNQFLTATGDTKIVMKISVGGAILNIVLNFALIPIYGILGAALATATARISRSFVSFYIINQKFDIHPFDRGYVLPTILICFALMSIYLLPVKLSKLGFFEGVVVSIGLGLLYLLFVLATRSVYTVEAELADVLLKVVGISTSASDLLEPFIR